MSDYEFHIELEDAPDLTTEDAKALNEALTTAVWHTLGDHGYDCDGVTVNVSAPEIEGVETAQLSVIADPHEEADDA